LAVGWLFDEQTHDSGSFEFIEESKQKFEELQNYTRSPWRNIRERALFCWHPLLLFLNDIEGLSATDWMSLSIPISSFKSQHPEEILVFFCFYLAKQH
jgi:hypothetical protein